MFDFHGVHRVAHDMGLHHLVVWMADNQSLYHRLLTGKIYFG